MRAGGKRKREMGLAPENVLSPGFPVSRATIRSRRGKKFGDQNCAVSRAVKINCQRAETYLDAKERKKGRNNKIGVESEESHALSSHSDVKVAGENSKVD